MEELTVLRVSEPLAERLALDGRAIRRWENEGGQCEHAA